MAFFHWIKVFFCGLCMGAADVVPGISGGTMAFILGIYEKLLWSIKSINLAAFKFLFTGRWSEFAHKTSFWFLFTLVAGIMLAVFSLANLIEYALNHETYRTYLYALFLGLVLASAILVGKKIEVWHVHYAVPFILGFACAFAVTYFPVNIENKESLYTVALPESQLLYATEGIVNYRNGELLRVPTSTLSAMVRKGIIPVETFVADNATGAVQPVKDLVEPSEVHFFNFYMIFCGAIAISAMLLPGISGSYLLVILGAYPLAIAAVSDTVKSLSHLNIDLEAISILLNLIVGVLLGAAAFSRIIIWCLNRYHNETISALMGFMLGALPSIWPYCTYEAYLLPLKLSKGPQLKVTGLVLPDPFTEVFALSMLWMIVGFSLVIGIHLLITRRKKGSS